MFYTKNGGTYMDVTWANTSETKTYTIDESNIVHIGNLVHHTARYYNHFVFDNLNVQLYSESEMVAAPQASVTTINGASRTITITPQDASHTVYYYIGDDNTNPIEYTEPIVMSESGTLNYYAQSTSGATSAVQSLEVNCVEVVLVAPTFYRTGADTYEITATQPATDGLTPIPTIHYTIAGGEEQTMQNGGKVSGVNGDIRAWAVATGYTNSEVATETYVAPYETEDVWSYNLNSFPSTYGITTIVDAIDESTETTLNELTVYNLKNIECPDLYVENSDGWLLRNQSSNAFKIQNSATSITFNNVAPGNLIYINGSDDNGRYRVTNVVNGEVAYCYDNNEYFIVPIAAGAVSVTFGTGVSINEVAVRTIKEYVSVNITSAGWATLYSDKALDFTGTGVKAYIGTVNGSSLTLTEVTTVPAETAVIIKGEEGPYDIPVIENSETDVAANALKGTLEEITLTNDSQTDYYAMKVLSNGNVGFALVADEGTVIPAGKAYLQLHATTEAAKVQFFSLGGQATGIEAVETQAKEDGKYYNLMGVEVENPQKGIYIKNGKKVVIK